jgi:sRNA-binding protein
LTASQKPSRDELLARAAQEDKMPEELLDAEQLKRRRDRVKKRKQRDSQRKGKTASSATRVRDYIYEDKVSKGCSRCPEGRPSCLHYHHLDRATKVSEISLMVVGGASLEVVKTEIAKCILLCANCHAVEELGTGFREDKVTA